MRRSVLAVTAALLLILLIAALIAVRSGGTADSTSEPAGTARVVEIVDGDTLVLDIAGSREPTRLLGIDTPETHHPTKPVECFGAEARDRLTELAPPGSVVRMERDVEARDHYGRLLAYVYPAGTGQTTSVNHTLVAEGFAVALPIDPNRAHRSELASAERAARAEQAGLWGACGGPGVAIDPLAGR